MPKPKFETCRFALVIDEDGEWNIAKSRDDDDEAIRNAAEDLAYINKIHFFEIKVPIPTAADFPTIRLNAQFVPAPVSEVAVTVTETASHVSAVEEETPAAA